MKYGEFNFYLNGSDLMFVEKEKKIEVYWILKTALFFVL